MSTANITRSAGEALYPLHHGRAFTLRASIHRIEIDHVTSQTIVGHISNRRHLHVVRAAEGEHAVHTEPVVEVVTVVVVQDHSSGGVRIV